MVVAFINAIMGAFNLVPFGIMDGWKVFRWNKAFWAVAFTVAVSLLVYTMI
jgi:Zn-dependent protease